jgi:DNA helicase-2/ATP-dependent DNA helicase PcrA
MGTTAILARTNRALAPFEQALSAAEIPFHYINRSGFFSQPEVQISLAYLGGCLFPANYLISTMIRGDFGPTKYLPRTKLAAKFKELKAADPEVSYWNLITKEPRSLVEPRNLEALQHFGQFVHSLSRYRDLLPAEGLKQVLGALKVGEHFADYDTIDNDPIANLNALVKMAEKHRSIKEFLDFCRRVTAASKTKRGVSLGTIHSAKGLEYNRVFLSQCSEGVLPHSKATDTDEERNILFVGASRAERELYVTYSGVPSIFLKDLKKTVQLMDEEK